MIAVWTGFSGDLLVVVQSAEDDKQSKVLRYSGSEEKQNIQFNDKKAPPYSSGGDNKYISENKKHKYMTVCLTEGPVH